MKKYDFYLVKVAFEDVEMIVKTNKDTTSYSEMKDLYDKTKSKVKEGDVSLVGVNEDGYTKIYSKNIEKKEQIDVVMNNLIENLSWLIEYSNKASELESAITMSRDMHLKKIELFNDFLVDDEDENIVSKMHIFEELREVMNLRRQIKYSNILVGKVTSKLNLMNILTVFKEAIASIEKNASAKVFKSDVVKRKEYDINDIFNIEDIKKISEIKNSFDKVCITPTKVIGYDINPLNKKDRVSVDEVEGEILYQNKDMKGNDNLVCVEKQLFKCVQSDHIAGFVKKRVNIFDIISKKDRNIYCYKFEPAENILSDKIQCY